MSWSASYVDGVDSNTLAESLAEEKAIVSPLNDEMREQFNAARAAAEALINSGALGSDKVFTVNFSGHANPGHEPVEGWSNDHVSISIGQKS